MRTPIQFIADAYRCFRNYRKWREAEAIAKAARYLWRRNDTADLSLRLMKIQSELYAEIHGKSK